MASVAQPDTFTRESCRSGEAKLARNMEVAVPQVSHSSIQCPLPLSPPTS